MHAIPGNLETRLRSYAWTRVTIGESRAAVYRLSAPGERDLFLKAQRREPLFNLQGEADRLVWLLGRAPVPAVVDFVTDATHDYLLTQALPGQDAATHQGDPARLVTALAEALRHLHLIDIMDCPFRHTADELMKRAESLLVAGDVDEENFDPENLGRPARDLFAEMMAGRPQSEDLVFTHGDFCLPNAIIDGGRVSGFIDVGTAGMGDRYRDLALIGRSLNRNLGAGWVEFFFARYGLSVPDPDKLRYYRLLDEFF